MTWMSQESSRDGGLMETEASIAYRYSIRGGYPVLWTLRLKEENSTSEATMGSRENVDLRFWETPASIPLSPLHYLCWQVSGLSKVQLLHLQMGYEHWIPQGFHWSICYIYVKYKKALFQGDTAQCQRAWLYEGSVDGCQSWLYLNLNIMVLYLHGELY